MSAAPQTPLRAQPHDYAICDFVARHFGRVAGEHRRGRAPSWWVGFQPSEIGGEGRSEVRIRRVPVPGGGWVRISSEEMARDVLATIRGSIRLGKSPRQAVLPYLPELAHENRFQAHYARFLEAKTRQHERGARQLSGKRLDELRGHLRRGHLEPLLDHPVQTLTYGTLEDWRDWLFAWRGPRGTGLSPNSVRKVVQDVHTFLAWLYRRGELDHLPARPEVQAVGYNPTVPPVQHQDAVFEAIPWPVRGLFLARGLMGLRPSEARRASVPDYDWEAPALRIVGKGGRPRIVPSHPDLHAWVEGHVSRADRLRAVGTEPAPLFTNPEADTAKNPSRRWCQASERRVMLAAYKRAGVPHYKPNEFLRHAFGTEVAMRLLSEGKSGGDVSRILMSIMGHTDTRTSNRYVQIATARLGWVYRER